MNKWVLDIKQFQDFVAVSKPKSDVTHIAKTLGYKELTIHLHNTRDMNKSLAYQYITGWLEPVETGDFFIYQYPSLMGHEFDNMSIDYLNKINAKVILFLHDSELLRGIPVDEIPLLNKCDIIIGHSEIMNNELIKRGVTSKIILKELFDYIVPKCINTVPNVDKKVVIAGNLAKSIFIQDWGIDDIELHAFGPKAEIELGGNSKYYGALPQKELIKSIPKTSFGICWDDILPGGGDYQQYTRYNSPHKFSLYLSLGLPVIVWDGSAMKDIVEKYHIGVSIDNPQKISPLIKDLSEEKSLIYKQNALKMSELIRNGMFTKRAIIDTEIALYSI